MIDQVIDRADLVEIANQAGAHLERSSGQYRGMCPLHGGDNPTGFVVYRSGGRQKWHCFTRDCGGGDVIDFVMIYKKMDFRQAVEYLGGGNSYNDPAEVARITLERAKRQQEELEDKIKLAQDALADLREAAAHLQYHANLAASEAARDIWRRRGVDDYWQDYWQLGYRSTYKVHTKSGWWTTPTITIPIYGQNRNLLNIRHRLLNPYTPGDKYRPERSGLTAMPFYADPDSWLDIDRVLVVEGEIKAMVTYLCADDHRLQVIGIPGKSSFAGLRDKLAGHTVYILLDPDARAEAMEYARQVRGRYIQLAMKVDDAILAGALDKQGLRGLIKNARVVR